MVAVFLWTLLMLLNFLKNHALVIERDKFLFGKEKGRGKYRLFLDVLIRTLQVCPSFILTGIVLGHLPGPPGAPLPALGVER